MPDLVWPNVEKATVAWLAGRTALPVYTETDPAPLPVEYLVVERVGGTGYGIEKDVDVEVTVTAATRSRMWVLAAAVETAMAALAANGDPYIDDVREAFGFAVEPSESVAVRRATATFTLTVRPRA